MIARNLVIILENRCEIFSFYKYSQLSKKSNNNNKIDTILVLVYEVF